MTDKEYTKQKKRLQKYIDLWFDPMGMNWFKIDMHYHRQRDEDNPRVAGKTETHWEYRMADIDWYMPSIADAEDWYLESMVIHEFVHVLIAPVMNVDTQESLSLCHEYATESISRAFQWVKESIEKQYTKKAP